MKVTYIRPGDGGSVTVDAEDGDTVMQAAVSHGIGEIVAECSGTLACATCHVYVSDDDVARVGQPGVDEDEMLDFTACPRARGSRLSCQIELSPELDGLVVHLPPEQ